MKKQLTLFFLAFLLIGCSCNLLQNGDFSQPALESGWRILNQLPGWQVKQIEQGIGSIYNQRWGNRVVLELDGNTNDYITQKVQLTPGFYDIEFEYAARSGWVQSSALAIYWNGALIKSVTSKDQQIYVFKERVIAKPGINCLQIRGEGTADSYGIGITNVKLTAGFAVQSRPEPVLPTRNLFTNPDFELPPRKEGWSILHRLPGWQVSEIEQGVGNIYNQKWGTKTVLELDGNNNNAISQTVHLVPGIYSFSLVHAARTGFISTSGVKVAINGQVFEQFMAQDDQIKKIQFTIQVLESGQYEFCISALGASDSYGMTIGFVSLSPVYGFNPGRARICRLKK